MDLTEKAAIKFLNTTLSNKSGSIVLHKINMQINDGDKCFIYGQSDEARTVILHSILGIIPPISGSIILNGINLNDLNKYELNYIRKQIGYSFPQKGLISELTVKENLTLPLRFNTALYGKEINNLLHKISSIFNFNDIFSKYPNQLNNLQMKLCNLARAIITFPKILLIDEPTSYLQEKDIKQMKQLIESIIFESGFVGKNCAVVITSEDKSWCMHLSDLCYEVSNNHIERIK